MTGRLEHTAHSNKGYQVPAASASHSAVRSIRAQHRACSDWVHTALIIAAGSGTEVSSFSCTAQQLSQQQSQQNSRATAHRPHSTRPQEQHHSRCHDTQPASSPCTTSQCSTSSTTGHTTSMVNYSLHVDTRPPQQRLISLQAWSALLCRSTFVTSHSLVTVRAITMSSLCELSNSSGIGLHAVS